MICAFLALWEGNPSVTGGISHTGTAMEKWCPFQDAITHCTANFLNHINLNLYLCSMISSIWHDDVIKWKHFPRYWPFVRGIHRSPVNSPHKKASDAEPFWFFICAWINGWVNDGDAGDVRRHRAHYDVTVMWLYGYCGWISIVYVCRIFGRKTRVLVTLTIRYSKVGKIKNCVVWWKTSRDSTKRFFNGTQITSSTFYLRNESPIIIKSIIFIRGERMMSIFSHEADVR